MIFAGGMAGRHEVAQGGQSWGLARATHVPELVHSGSLAVHMLSSLVKTEGGEMLGVRGEDVVLQPGQRDTQKLENLLKCEVLLVENTVHLPHHLAHLHPYLFLNLLQPVSLLPALALEQLLSEDACSQSALDDPGVVIIAGGLVLLIKAVRHDKHSPPWQLNIKRAKRPKLDQLGRALHGQQLNCLVHPSSLCPNETFSSSTKSCQLFATHVQSVGCPKGGKSCCYH